MTVQEELDHLIPGDKVELIRAGVEGILAGTIGVSATGYKILIETNESIAHLLKLGWEVDSVSWTETDDEPEPIKGDWIQNTVSIAPAIDYSSDIRTAAYDEVIMFLEGYNAIADSKTLAKAIHAVRKSDLFV